MNDHIDYIYFASTHKPEPIEIALYPTCKVCGNLVCKEDSHEPLCDGCGTWLATILLNSVLPSQNRLNRLERIEQMTHDRVDRLDQRLVQHEADTPKFADRIYELRTELRRWTNQRIGNLVGQLRNLDSRLWDLRTFPSTCYECHKPYRGTELDEDQVAIKKDRTDFWLELERSIVKRLKNQQEHEAQLLSPDTPDRALCEWDGFQWQPVEETCS